MSTPVSASTPYCTVAQFLEMTDWRTIMHLMGDHGANVTPTRSTLADSTSVEGGRLLKLLMASSGDVEAAVSAGGTYTPTSLGQLTGASAAYLQSLVRDLTVGRCYRRRPNLYGPPPQEYEEAMMRLKEIRDGANVLGLQENIDAQLMQHVVNTPQDVQQRYGMVVQSRAYFGTRGNQRLPGYGGSYGQPYGW